MSESTALDALILTGEPLPLPGRVTSGAGLRAWGLKEGLRCAGLDAWVATRAMAMEGIAEDEASRHHTALWEPDTIASLVDRLDPACVVSQHWGILHDVPPLSPPLAIDLAGPHLLERRLWGAENWAEHLEEKLAALRRADFTVCSGERQRLYFLNHLALAGFDLTSETLPVIPFSVSPDLPEGDHAPDTFFCGGMFLPWQDPSLPIQTLIEVLEECDRGHLHFWGGPHPRLDVSRGRFEALMERLESSERVTCHGLTAFDALSTEMVKCGVALDLMASNPERELAYPTRTVVHLWAGLPVIHGDFDELGEIIQGAEAGWSLAPGDAERLRDTIHQILDHPEQVTERRANAQRLVRERLTWDRTIGPLADWCRSPARREGKTAFTLAFESKDREIAELRSQRTALQSELDTLRGKLSWRVAQGLLSLRWLWAVLVWVALIPVCLIGWLWLTVVDLLPARRDAVHFPAPPGKTVDTDSDTSR
jgi:hypothetical protein